MKAITPVKLLTTTWTLSYEQVIVMLALYFAIVLNFPVTYKLYQLAGEGHLAFALSPALVLFCCFLIIFSLLAIPYLFKPLLTLIILSSAAATYAIWKYQIVFDYGMVENILATNSGEALSYVNIYSVLYYLALGGLPVWLLYRTQISSRASWLKAGLFRAGLIVVSCLILALLAALFYKDYASVGRNNRYITKMIVPAHVYYGVRYAKRTFFSTPLKYVAFGQDAVVKPSKNGKPNLVVLVVGETARAHNMQYNGYQRETNPYTQGFNLIALQNVSSCGTATAHSLPCMMSNLSHDNFKRERADSQDNVLDVMAHAGVDVTWLENDGGDKHVAKNITKHELTLSQGWDGCQSLSCYDEVLVQQLAQLVDAKGKPSDQLVALHIIGSHGPTYYQRYPKDMEVFKPACRRSDIENCSDEEIVNVYDNTLVYTDYVLAQTIKLLQGYSEQYNVALMYLSDHGESLGENGLYLHGTPYAFAPTEQTQVPWLIWLPEEYASAQGINRDCLAQAAKTGTFSHDNLFHSLLDFYGVETQAKQAELDFIAGCRG
ncbi:phosphoethanolamine transferase [Motilimonas cestriensis]|uniref:phosphoethanolamine transferase n=1 Tax=Motilimonas cestriensis TaxID=2742685 RepID=UPI003DA39C51